MNGMKEDTRPICSECGGFASEVDKHAQAIAMIIRDCSYLETEGSDLAILPYSLQLHLLNYFTEHNPNFDRARFQNACRWR